MLSDTLLAWVRTTLHDLDQRRAIKIGQKMSLLDVTGRMRDRMEELLGIFDLEDIPPSLEVWDHAYAEAAGSKKMLKYSRRQPALHRQPSIILHEPGTDDFNILAMKVKVNGRASRREIAGNYGSICGLILDPQRRYQFGLCVELNESWRTSKAYWTSYSRLTAVAQIDRDEDVESFFRAESYSSRRGNKRETAALSSHIASGSSRGRPVAEDPLELVPPVRDRLFEDVSKALFGQLF